MICLQGRNPGKPVVEFDDLRAKSVDFKPDLKALESAA